MQRQRLLLVAAMSWGLVSGGATLEEKAEMVGLAGLGAFFGSAVGATVGQTVVTISGQEAEVQDGFASMMAGAGAGAITALHFTGHTMTSERTMRQRIEAGQKGMQIGAAVGTVLGSLTGSSSGSSDGDSSPMSSSMSQSSPSSSDDKQKGVLLLQLMKPNLGDNPNSSSSNGKSPLVSHALAGAAAGFAVGMIEPEVVRFSKAFGSRASDEKAIAERNQAKKANAHALLNKLSDQVSALRASKARVPDAPVVRRNRDGDGPNERSAMKKAKDRMKLAALRRAIRKQGYDPEVMKVVDVLTPDDMQSLKPMMRGERVSEDFLRDIANRSGMSVMKLQSLFEENDMYKLSVKDAFF